MADETSRGAYLVRGAMLCCRQGTHPRRLNLPQSYGVYAYEHPQITNDDCTPENIPYFGVCCSETPPEGAEVVRLAGYVPEGSTEQAEDVQGLKCTPDIIGKWNNPYGKAVTMDSYLICACGGIIEPKTSGEEYED